MCDATDRLCQRWADTRRQLLGLTDPRTHQEFVGAIKCTLGGVQQHHDGAGSFTAREQRFPEVYTGDALLVNNAFKQMPPRLQRVMDLRYCVGRGAGKLADLIGLSKAQFWADVRAAKRFVEGYLAGAVDRAA